MLHEMLHPGRVMEKFQLYPVDSWRWTQDADSVRDAEPIRAQVEHTTQLDTTHIRSPLPMSFVFKRQAFIFGHPAAHQGLQRL